MEAFLQVLLPRVLKEEVEVNLYRFQCKTESHRFEGSMQQRLKH